MRERALLAAVLLACAGPRPHPPSGDLVLSVGGKVEQGTFTFGTGDLPALPRRSFVAVPPDGGRARFEGLDVVGLLADHVDVSHAADIALFRGGGGEVAVVPLAALRQLRPVLADTVDGAPVKRWRTAAAPLQLAWPNVEQPGIDTDPRMRGWWAGGVSRVDLQNWNATYGRALRVPSGARDDARRGAGVLATSCLGCHRLRGQGGTAAPPLREYRVGEDTAAFSARLRSHLTRVAASTRPLDAEAAARDVAAFLRALEVTGAGDEAEEPPQQEQQQEPAQAAPAVPPGVQGPPGP